MSADRGPYGPQARGENRRSDIGSIVAIVVMVALVAVLEYATVGSAGKMSVQTQQTLLLLYRRLYYIPIIYAAFVFGKRGGLTTAVIVSALFAVNHFQMFRPSALVGLRVNNALEIVTYVAIGLLFGALRDAEEAKTRDLTAVSSQLEEAYRKLEERAIQLINVQDYTQSILRSITSGVLTVGPDGSVATANPAAERLLGVSEFEMVPKPISALFRDDGGLSGDVAKVLSGRLPLTLREVTMVTGAGREIHVQASTSRMRAVGGAVLGAVVTLEDVSEVRALTDQLIRADRLAAMGELTAGVAHEVRNPLGVIKASVQLLEDANCDAERIHKSADVIKQEIDRLDKVVKALLDFGRPSTPTMTRIDLPEVLRDVVLFTDRFAKQSNVHIETSFAGDMPDVMGDPDQLKQVFLNLVTNAVQAMEVQGGTIRVSGRATNGYVEVTVQDDGPGIPQEDLSKVFDPFFTKRAEGTGLGLTIVHRILDEHDGHIEVTSGPEGTTFVVSLPALDE